MAPFQTLSYNAFPPHCHVSSAKPISAATTLVHIQSYLDRAQDAAHLHPDASFNENGPQFARHASEGGLILQLLRRVEKGLKGERIITELPGENALATLSLPTGTIENEEVILAGDDSGFGQNYAPRNKKDGLDADEQAALESGSFVGKSYNEQMIDEGEDGITDGEIAPRNTFVRDLTGASSGNKRKLTQVGDSSKMSKEMRKRAKKDRHLEERRRQQKEKERQNRVEKDGKGVHNDVEMGEVAVVAPDENDDAVDKLKPLNSIVQNDALSKHAVTGSGAKTKAEKKAQRRAQNQTEQQT